MKDKVLIKVENLKKHYNGGKVKALDGVIVEEGTPEDIFENPQAERTIDFLKCVL